MLVLSRREDDKIVFPNLGITVEVLRIAGRSVRLGVTAPGTCACCGMNWRTTRSRPSPAHRGA